MIKPVFWSILVLFFNLRLGSATIYRINASEYEKLPPVFYLEPYEKCMEHPNAIYCVTELVLVSDTPNQLLDTIREYSAHTSTHYNHTLQRYGICLNTCKHALDIKRNRRDTLEACLNETYWLKYGLKTNLQEQVYCNDAQENIKIETNDIIFLIVFVVILLINLVGSLCDVYLKMESKRFGMRWLTVFSICQNWRKLMKPGAEGSEPRLKQLKGISSIKVMTTVLVITGHTLITALFYVNNPKTVENYYQYGIVHLLVNGPIVVQTFFVNSGFLLAYNILLLNETHQIGWSMLPKGFFLRWIRLTSPYALLMFFTVTWIRLVGSGPGWSIAVLDEVNDCRKYWWQNLFYINNYYDESQCFLHTWYLAADTHLYCLGLVVFVACKSWTSRKVVLSLLLLLGLVIPPLITYMKDLDGIVVVSPETIIHFFITNPSYNYLYKRSHSNIFPYAIGLTAGCLVYHLQNIDFDIQKYKKYRWISRCCFPLGVIVVWSGAIFYWDGPRPSMLVRVAYAALMKPTFNVLLFFGTFVLVLKYDKFLNFILESKMWTVLGRLSYSAYLIHVTILRIMMGTRTVETHSTALLMSQQGVYLVCLSFTAALPVWLFVEQPFYQLAKVLFMSTASREKRPEKRVKRGFSSAILPMQHAT